MFEVEKQWISRLYQALYMAELFENEDIIFELKMLELKFFKLTLEDFEWSRLGEIEDILEL